MDDQSRLEAAQQLRKHLKELGLWRYYVKVPGVKGGIAGVLSISFSKEGKIRLLKEQNQRHGFFKLFETYKFTLMTDAVMKIATNWVYGYIRQSTFETHDYDRLVGNIEDLVACKEALCKLPQDVAKTILENMQVSKPGSQPKLLPLAEKLTELEYSPQPSRNKEFIDALFADKKIQEILARSACKSIEELCEMAKISVTDYLILKRLGSGAIKKAYLAQNVHSGGESVLLMIDPNSKGFQHYANIHKNLKPDQLLEKIYAEEFSGIKLRELSDTRFISLINPPIAGTYHGENVFFMETPQYETTLEATLEKEKTDKKAIPKYIHQMAIALQNCHKEKVVHKDLKPDNIGITKKDNIVLTDFGCTSMFSEGDTRYQYPLLLRPPELAHDENYWQEKGLQLQSELFTPEANVWTLGAIAYWMFTGKHLFELGEPRAPIGTEEYHKQNKIVYDKIRGFKENGYPMIPDDKGPIFIPAASEIVHSCLRVNPEDRKGALEKVIEITKKYT